MLKDLKVLNGVLDLAFNEYTYEYTVTVEEDIEELELSYVLEDDCNIEILDNELQDGENTVYLNVYNVDKEETYTLYVYRENSKNANGIKDYMASLEVSKNEEINVTNIQFLTVGMFLTLIIFFSIIFRRKKHR